MMAVLSQPLDVLRDEDIQTLVSSLQEDVRDRNYQLRALQSEVGTIRDQIQERHKERQIFTSNTIHVEEAAVLVEENEQLKKSLQSKQKELRSLEDGSSLEQRELQKDREQLVACQRDQEAIQRQKEAEDTSVEELKNKYEEEQELCEASRPQLQKAKQELASCQDKLQSQKKPSAKPLDVRLDMFIMKSCKKAGLQL